MERCAAGFFILSCLICAVSALRQERCGTAQRSRLPLSKLFGYPVGEFVTAHRSVCDGQDGSLHVLESRFESNAVRSKENGENGRAGAFVAIRKRVILYDAVRIAGGFLR